MLNTLVIGAGLVLIALGVIWIVVAALATAIAAWLARHKPGGVHFGGPSWAEVALALINLMQKNIPAQYIGGFLLIIAGVGLILGDLYLSGKSPTAA